MPPNSFQAFRRQAIIQHQPIIHHQTIIQHPPVITRTPAHHSTTGKTTNNTITTTSASTSTTTTPEPTEAPEIDDDYLPAQRPAIISFNHNFPYNYNYAPTTFAYDFYGLGLGYNNVGVVAGGISREVDYEFNPPANQQQQQQQQQKPQSYASRQTQYIATTARAPTTKTTQATGTVTPELDDDLISSPTTGKTAAQDTYSGYCFCSPLSQCPVDSVPRGGLCNNFLAYFINLKFIRCCYSPSVARSLQL